MICFQWTQVTLFMYVLTHILFLFYLSLLFWWFHQLYDLKVSIWCDWLKIIPLELMSLLNTNYVQWPTNIATWVLNRLLKVTISKTESWLLLPHPHTCSSQNLSCCTSSNFILLVFQAKCGIILYLALSYATLFIRKILSGPPFNV